MDAAARKPAPPRRPLAGPGWERWAVWSILAGFVIVAFNSIHNTATIGQDMLTHVTNTKRLLSDPGHWFTGDMTFRPFFYWIGGWCVWFTHDRYGYELASMVFTLAAMGALALLHDATRRVISSPLARVAGIALVAFWPLTVITTVVYAADTAASLPFVLAGWGAMRCLEEDTEGKALACAALSGLGFTIGTFSKATFLGLPAAVLFVLLALWRAGRLPAPRAWMLAGLAVAVPGAAGGWIMAKAERDSAGASIRHSFNWHGTGELTFRSLAGVKFSDRRIFNAPEYLASEVRDGMQFYPLLVANNYSYPALLHLGIFTDVLNFANHTIVPRPEPQRTAARWSVRLGLVFSLAALAAVLAFWIGAAAGFLRPDGMPSAPSLVWSSLALAWYLPIAAALPFVDHVYIMGYWLPRLVMPALWIFFLSGFAALDRLPGRWARRSTVAAAILTAVLCAAEIRSVWY